MNLNISNFNSKSTPKRRRLVSRKVGLSRVKKNKVVKESLLSVKNEFEGSERCESPQIPCNQDEYFNSVNSSNYGDNSITIDEVFSNSEMRDETWDNMEHTQNILNEIGGEVKLSEDNHGTCPKSYSLNTVNGCSNTIKISTFNNKIKKEIQNKVVTTGKITKANSPKSMSIYCNENINKNQKDIGNINQIMDNTHTKKSYEDFIEDSFDLVNQSICNLDKCKQKNNDYPKNIDPGLQGYKENSILEENLEVDFLKEINFFSDQFIDTLPLDNSFDVFDIESKSCIEKGNPKTKEQANLNFYGLPMATKDLFKTYRNIEKFYDWQEQCLNLDAIKERRNLVYALPTSGGKTLVAEVLMLREVLNRKKNALFILPYVAIVQEKIWSLSPFAVQLDFLLEEYTGGKGPMPPKKRRKKNSIYVATIEKGLALIRSLIELKRLDELGLIVVDELHLIGEKGRGGTLETLLSTVIFANQNIQIIGMSATIGNLDQVATFLKAEIFERNFRPVELTEYVKLGRQLYRINWRNGQMDLEPDRELAYNYTKLAASMDPDLLGGLVSEVVPEGSCLVFCPTKRNCENVVSLLCKLQRKEMVTHRTQERMELENSLRAEGSNSELVRSVRFGIAYHHAGLAADERLLLENAFRSGVISVICCTSTLAAGVNLPARRVVVRAPLVASRFLTLSAYRQMVGRAGRAGVCNTGESIIICSGHEWARLQGVLSGGLEPATSSLRDCAAPLILGAVALDLGNNRSQMKNLMACTFLAVAGHEEGPVDIDSVCDNTIHSLMQSGGLEVKNPKGSPDFDSDTNIVLDDSLLYVSKLGKAAIKGCMDLSNAKQLVQDLEIASRSLVLMGSLHLLYLVTPQDAAGVKPDFRHYYTLYCNLDKEALQTAKVLGINESNAIRMVTGKEITNVSAIVLRRFYLALMLHDLWNQMPLSAVSEKYMIARGTVQGVLQTSSSLASSAQRFCEELPDLWAFALLFGELAPRLRHCSTPDLHQLLELPAVKKARAMQLMRAGYKRIEDIAKAQPDDLVSSITHLTRTTAGQLISAARMMLIEKVENLRAEAEDVMVELNL